MNNTKTLTQADLDILLNVCEDTILGVMLIDESDQQIIAVNRIAEEIVGMDREDIVGHKCYSVVCPAHEGACPIIDLKQEIDNSERFIITAANDMVPIIKIVNRINVDGKPLLLEMFIDNRSRKATEDELIQEKHRAENLYSELKAAQNTLIENAHKAGQADIAVSVLHNVGNLLNSLITSTEFLRDKLKRPELVKLEKANLLLRDNMDNIEDFILNNPKGKSLLQYYLKIEEQLKQENATLREETARAIEKVDAIKEVIVAQQAYPSTSLLSEKLPIMDIIEDALIIQEELLQKNNIVVEKLYSETPPIAIQKTKLIHILINLINNAKDALQDNPFEERFITIELKRDGDSVFIRFADNGSGVDPDNVSNIFNHSFTTKKDGHGFGLHSCANYMTEMGGKIWVESEGEGLGATFIARFPV